MGCALGRGRLIVDANVLVSALLGRSLPLLADIRSRGIELLIPQHQFGESRLIVAREGWSTDRFAHVSATVLEVLPTEVYAAREADARDRLEPRGQPDWPVLAAALQLDDAIWSNDRDFFGVGVSVWKTTNIGLTNAHS